MGDRAVVLVDEDNGRRAVPDQTNRPIVEISWSHSVIPPRRGTSLPINEPDAPALKHATALHATTFGGVIGAVVCLPFAGQLVSDVTQAPLAATLNVVYLGVFPTAIAFTTWAYALARTAAGKMGATTYAVPAVVVVMSWTILSEVPGWLTLAGGALKLDERDVMAALIEADHHLITEGQVTPRVRPLTSKV